MICTKCNHELPAQAKFCPNCAATVPQQPTIQVQQDVGTVKGAVTGAILGADAMTAGVNASTTQRIETVESGGAAIGAIIGDRESPIHVGGEQHYDQRTEGDQINVGNITGSQGLAIGRHAQATVTTGISDTVLGTVFAPLWHTLQQVPPENQAAAMQQAKELQSEVAKGKSANDERVADLLNGLVKLVPGAVSAVVSAFASPLLAGIAGPVTKYVLKQLGLPQG